MKPLHQTLIEELQGEFWKDSIQDGCHKEAERFSDFISHSVTKTLERVRGEIEGIPMIWTYRSPELIPKSKALATLTTNKEEETTKD